MDHFARGAFEFCRSMRLADRAVVCHRRSLTFRGM